MRSVFKFQLVALTCAFALTACSGAGETDETAANGEPDATAISETTVAPEPTAVAASDAPPVSWARCAVCHTVDRGGANKLGPNLYGVFGQPAGHNPDFNYSDALKNSGFVWNEESLNTYLENPRAAIPGNRMSFPGLATAQQRQEIIDYLKKQS